MDGLFSVGWGAETTDVVVGGLVRRRGSARARCAGVRAVKSTGSECDCGMDSCRRRRRMRAELAADVHTWLAAWLIGARYPCCAIGAEKGPDMTYDSADEWYCAS